MTIVDFIEARISEDEATARAATDDGHNWLVEEETISLWPDDREPCDGFMGFPRKAHAHHAVQHSPARVLRQCAAIRHAIEAIDNFCDDPYPSKVRIVNAALEPIAAIWSDHPDYESWHEEAFRS